MLRCAAACAALIASACGAGPGALGGATGASSASSARPAEPAKACALPGEPIVVRRDGAASLERWDVDADPVLFSSVLPADPGYTAYRDAIRAASAELEYPVADPPVPRDDAERDVWSREAQNQVIAYSGRAGTIRPIQCLEAWFFARQHVRHSQLTSPTEFILSVLEKREGGRRRLRLYFSGGDQMFPPQSVYGFDVVAADVAQGWEYLAAVHNHTIQRHGDRPALGVTVPSTSDVQLLRHLAADLKLRAAWVTNGVYTIEVPAAALARYLTRD